MKRILITGGGGFIGSHTADALVKQGHTVRVLDSLDPQVHGGAADFPSYMHPEVECIKGNVCDAGEVSHALEGIDVVYHLAAMTGVGQSMYDLRNYVETNCVGTATLLEAIVKQRKQVERLILSSSRAVYGEGTHRCETHGILYPPPRQRENLQQGQFDVYCPECGATVRPVPTKEKRSLMPNSVYAYTKKQQEEYCQYVSETFALPVVALRYFNVYGPRQSLQNPYTGILSIFYSRIMADQPISLYERGLPGRDFVHVSDVVQANVRAHEVADRSYICLNVGTGMESKISDVARELANACGQPARIRDDGEFRVGDIHCCYADLEETSLVLGYKPQISLNEGVAMFAAWAKGQNSIDQYEKTVEELERYGLYGKAVSSTT